MARGSTEPVFEILHATGTQAARYSGVRSSLREPKPPPYDDDDREEETPAVPPRRSQRCRVCLGTGRIHLIRPIKEMGRGRRCPACRGSGWAREARE